MILIVGWQSGEADDKGRPVWKGALTLAQTNGTPIVPAFRLRAFLLFCVCGLSSAVVFVAFCLLLFLLFVFYFHCNRIVVIVGFVHRGLVW